MVLIMTNNFMASARLDFIQTYAYHYHHTHAHTRPHKFFSSRINCNNLITIQNQANKYIYYDKMKECTTKDGLKMAFMEMETHGRYVCDLHPPTNKQLNCAGFEWNKKPKKLNHKSRDFSKILYFALPFDVRATQKCRFSNLFGALWNLFVHRSFLYAL